ncbi:UNVERIFIED_CONTAM: hypothetical protein Sradi_5297100 [Sesamum radiatum]|uniref:Uncharacterized protein n=1 Tax=Sesamum radiatum TaxID=300843 RepID=A0AAW2LMP6_SESRA
MITRRSMYGDSHRARKAQIWAIEKVIPDEVLDVEVVEDTLIIQVGYTERVGLTAPP